MTLIGRILLAGNIYLSRSDGKGMAASQFDIGQAKLALWLL